MYSRRLQTIPAYHGDRQIVTDGRTDDSNKTSTTNFLGERYYVMFALWHGPLVCHLSVCLSFVCEVRASNSEC